MRTLFDDASNLTRVHNSLLASRERQLLTMLAARVPSRISPDDLTMIGVAGGAMVAVGCVAANLHYGFLGIAILGLVINWFGDSLDGSLARFRRIERPRYGFYVDQVADVTAHFFILFGLGLSPLMRLDVALMALLGSLAIMFYGHLKLQFSRTWQVSHHGVGPTELRIIIAGGFALGMLGLVPELDTPVGAVSLFDAVGMLVFIGSLISIALMFLQDRAKLAAIDPPRDGVPAEVKVTQLNAGA